MMLNRSYILWLSVFGLMFVSAGCSVFSAADIRKDAEAENVRTFVFHCDDDSTFVARIEGDRAWLFLPSETLDLAQTSSGEFNNGDVVLKIADQTAVFEDGSTTRQCRNNRSEAIWEHAKLNGADFRAIGNEPGWNLEIREGSKAILVTDYGSTRYNFTLLPPQTNQTSATTTFTSSGNGPKMILKITGGGCSDNMSGEKFESSVEIDLDGDVLRGCGRALH